LNAVKIGSKFVFIRAEHKIMPTSSSDVLIPGANDTKPYPSTAQALIESTIYDLLMNATFLRHHSLQARRKKDAMTLRTAAKQIRRLSSRLERAMRSREGS
jgi:hypothetical protein